MDTGEDSMFSRFDHIGLVVRDLEKAIAYYQSLGIGPFEQIPLDSMTDRMMHGEPCDFDMKVAKAQIGEIAVELIQPVKNCALLEEFLERNGEGINHICFLVSDLAKEEAKMVDKGFKIILSARHPTGGADYFDTREVGGVIIEIAQR